MIRPAVDVVMPFAGAEAEREAALQRLAGLAVRDGDTLTLVDNRPDAADGASNDGRVAIVAAPALASSYHARNRGAARGTAEWLVFLDADVEPAAALLDAYFEPAPDDRVAVLAGAVEDEPAPAGRRGAALRYQRLKRSMSQETTLGHAGWAFAQTANCAVRRAAFDEAGGFREVISGGDADLCFRLAAAGWEIESRPQARATHRSRTSLRALLRQQARHGAGLGWLAAEHPGAFPARRLPGLALWSLRSEAAAAAAVVRGRRDEALVRAVDAIAVWAVELGRRRGNDPTVASSRGYRREG